MNRRLLSTALLVFLLSIAPGAGAGELSEAVKKSGVIHISVNAIYPPMEYKDPQTNQLTGGVHQFTPAWAMGY